MQTKKKKREKEKNPTKNSLTFLLSYRIHIQCRKGQSQFWNKRSAAMRTKQHFTEQEKYTAFEPKQTDDLFVHLMLQFLAQPAPYG